MIIKRGGFRFLSIASNKKAGHVNVLL